MSSDLESGSLAPPPRRRRHKHRKRKPPNLRQQLFFRWWHIPLALGVGIAGIFATQLILGNAFR